MNETAVQKSQKGFVPTLLLALFLGGLGIHRFFVGKIGTGILQLLTLGGTGILQLLTLGGLGIWALIDIIMIAVGAFKDKAGLPIKA
jgi:TM2 domain-containing membrane protein YozV